MNYASRPGAGRAAVAAAGLLMTFSSILTARADVRRGTLPVGTVIPVKLEQSLSSKNSQPGDKFSATVKYGRDDAGLPQGTRVEGIVREALPSADGKPGVVDVDFRSIVFPDGSRKTIDASLYSLDGKSIKRSDGRLVATANASKDRLKWVGIGAGAGVLLSTLTKGNALLSGLLGAAGGYLFNEVQNKKPGDVTLKEGSEFGVRLDRQLAYNYEDRGYTREPGDSTSDRYFDDRTGDRNYDDRPGDRYRSDRPGDRPGDRYYNRTRPTEDDWRLRNDPNRDPNDIGVLFNDREMRFTGDARPFMRGNIVFVPLESVSRTAKFDYRYDALDRTIRVNNGKIRLPMESRIAFVNGERRRLPAAAEIRNGIVYVPMQFVAWAANGSASWDNASHTVVITTDRDRY